MVDLLMEILFSMDLAGETCQAKEGINPDDKTEFLFYLNILISVIRSPGIDN